MLLKFQFVRNILNILWTVAQKLEPVKSVSYKETPFILKDIDFLGFSFQAA